MLAIMEESGISITRLLSLIFTIYILLSNGSETIGASANPSATLDNASLIDRPNTSQWPAWKACKKGESCRIQRKEACSNSSRPYETCKTKVWKEEIHNCFACSGKWLESTWSKCMGTGCEDTIQTLEHTCANGNQQNCKKIQTRFCSPNKVCHGTWSDWEYKQPECLEQCTSGKQRFQNKIRKCMNGNVESGSCEALANGNIGSNTLEEVEKDNCESQPCPSTTTSASQSTTTTKSTTPTISSTTTTTSSVPTPPRVTLTKWSPWICDATSCLSIKGNSRRYRNCIYENGTDAPKESCSNAVLKDSKECTYKDAADCVKESKVTVEQKSLSIATPKPAGGGPDRRIKGPLFPIVELNTTGNYLNVTADGQGMIIMDRWQYRVLIIVLATTAFLIILVIALFLCLRKRNKKRKYKKGRKREISVVGLQRHSGFSDGGEFERLRRSTMTGTGNEIDETGNNIPAFDVSQLRSMTTPSRQLPQIPLGTNRKSNKDHIYEEMVVNSSLGNFPQGVYHDSGNRISSDLDEQNTRRRANTIASISPIVQPSGRMRRSMSMQPTDGILITSHKTTPAKPPRKSRMFHSEDNLEAGGIKTKNIPTTLYGSHKKFAGDSTPNLGNIIDNIQPPSYPPPAVPARNSSQNLAPMHDINQNRSKSAPNSPYHSTYQAKQGNEVTIVPSAYLPTYTINMTYNSNDNQSKINTQMNPVFIQHPTVQLMMPSVASQNNGVLFVPVSPIYSTVATTMVNHPTCVTPLHAPGDSVSERDYQRTSDKSTMLVPEISISEATGKQVSPNKVYSPSMDYTDMRQFAKSDEQAVENELPVQYKSLRQLHGTHSTTPIKNNAEIATAANDDNNKNNDVNEGDNTSKNLLAAEAIEEDKDGYLVANSPVKVHLT